MKKGQRFGGLRDSRKTNFSFGTNKMSFAKATCFVSIWVFQRHPNVIVLFTHMGTVNDRLKSKDVLDGCVDVEILTKWKM